MYDLFDRGVEFPVTSEWDEEALSSDVVTMRCPEDYEVIYPPPTGAEAHLVDKRFNFQYHVGLQRHIKDLLDDDAVTAGISSGWIIGMPERAVFNVGEDDLVQTREVGTDVVKSAWRWTLGPNGPVVPVAILRLGWVPDVSDGYSLLVTKPSIGTETNGPPISVFTHLIDADRIEQYLDIPIMFHSHGECHVKHGTPIAQVIPIPRRLMRADAKFHPPADDTTDND